MFAKVRILFIGIFFVAVSVVLPGQTPHSHGDWFAPTEMTLTADQTMTVDFYVNGYFDGRIKVGPNSPVTFPFPDRELDVEWRFYNPYNNFHICSVNVPYDKEGVIHLTKDRCKWKEVDAE